MTSFDIATNLFGFTRPAKGVLFRRLPFRGRHERIRHGRKKGSEYVAQFVATHADIVRAYSTTRSTIILLEKNEAFVNSGTSTESSLRLERLIKTKRQR